MLIFTRNYVRKFSIIQQKKSEWQSSSATGPYQPSVSWKEHAFIKRRVPYESF